MLSRDAYDEFARAPYATVKKLKPKMNRDQLLAWIADPNVPPSRKRLYFTMLGVCGNAQDTTMLERRLRGTDAESRSGLDALIACYLTLRGPEGVPLIEELFLKSKEGTTSDNYADVYAAIMALRFHGTEGDVVPRARVLQAFSLVLDNPQMADLVIPDLARWQDWSQLERLVEMFKRRRQYQAKPNLRANAHHQLRPGLPAAGRPTGTRTIQANRSRSRQAFDDLLPDDPEGCQITPLSVVVSNHTRGYRKPSTN